MILTNYRLTREVEKTLTRGVSTPDSKHNKKVERYKREIREILDVFGPQSSTLGGNLGVSESTTLAASVVSGDATTTSLVESGMS